MARPHGISIPDRELSWRFSRSSGPGGQSVNTTDSRVELIWDLGATAAVTEPQKTLARQTLRNRLEGDTITVVASTYKSQHRNREDAKSRLEALVVRAIVPPKTRRATKPSKASKQRRIDAKKQRGSTKKLRQRPNGE